MTSINLRFIHHPTINALFALVTLVSLAFTGPLHAQDFEQITIVSDDSRHEFRVEVMRKSQDRARGLMYRKHLDQDAGMLFDFGRQLTARMWMRNTYIPLDMIFIHENGEIINIAANTVPHSEEILSSAGNVRYVLEINGGLSAKLGIKAGDRVELPKP